MFDNYWIDKSVLIKTGIVFAVIILIILSVKVRIGLKQKEQEEGKVNYVTYEGSEGTMVIIDFDKVTRYFTNEADGEPFKKQIAQFIIDSGSDILEWYVEDVKLDKHELSLNFILTNKENYECFKVSKTNELTNIVHEYEQKKD